MSEEDEARFGKLWTDWDRRIAAGQLPIKILQNAQDEDLIEILAGESKKDRKEAREAIAKEILDRMHARTTTQHPGAQRVEDTARVAHRVTQGSQAAIHHAETLLKRSGEVDLGTAVSASADASLVATKAAFDSAKVQADTLHETLEQSRVGAELSAEAARVADQGREVTRELEDKMKRMGHSKEGRAASEASRDIQKATEHAAKDSAEHDAKRRAD